MERIGRFGLVALACVSLGCAALGFEKTWKSYDEKVTAGERERIASHGRWDDQDGHCVGEAPPRLVVKQQPAHGSVEFGQKTRTPSGCDSKIPHAAVYYTADADYVGKDRFSYHRIDPDTQEKRLVVVELIVGAP